MRFIADSCRRRDPDAGDCPRGGRAGRSGATDVSAAAKKKKAPAKPKEEYLKAAPGTGPSGPARKNRS